MELPVASLLRPLAPEHRPHRVELGRGIVGGQVVLDHGAHDPRRGLGPQRERGAALVLECIHLLGDDVGLGPDAAREQLRLLEDRGADLAVAVAGEQLAGRGLDAVPRAHLVGKDVPRPLDGLDPRLAQDRFSSAR